jgi:hypothetical protein
LKPPPPPTPVELPKPREEETVTLRPEYTAYWQEGVGEGGEKPWKFRCSCGEVCSSYENYRYHPIGRMFECSRCHYWSHVSCVLGNVSDDDLEEMGAVHCSSCATKLRRLQRYYGEDYEQHDDKSDVWLEGSAEDLADRKKHGKSGSNQSNSESVLEAPDSKTESTSNQSGSIVLGINVVKRVSISADKIGVDVKSSSGKKVTKNSDKSTEEEGEWKFACKCKEVCSSYENPLYHPIGRKFQCTECNIWSHINCIFGAKISDEEMEKMEVRNQSFSFLHIFGTNYESKLF